MISRAQVYGGTQFYAAHTAAITLNGHSVRMHVVECASALNLTLPDARILRRGGPVYVVCNVGSSGADVTVKDAGGSTLIVLEDGESVKLSVLSNTTQAGDWVLDERSLTAVGAAKPSYSLLFGGRAGSATLADRCVRLDHVTRTHTESSDSGTTQQGMDQGCAFDIAGVAHRSPGVNTSLQLHLEYQLDTWTTRSKFSPSATAFVRPTLGFVYNGKGIHIHNFVGDLWEWDITDTWVELGGNFGSDIRDYKSSHGVPGPISGDAFVHSADASPNVTSSYNNFVRYNRVTDTTSDAPSNPSIQLLQGGGAWLGSGSQMHVVGGHHAITVSGLFTDSDALHFAYDTSLGLFGSWTSQTPHTNPNVPGPGAYRHPTIESRGVMMSGNSGTDSSDFSGRTWFFDDDTLSWDDVGDLPVSRRKCWSMSCHLTNT